MPKKLLRLDSLEDRVTPSVTYLENVVSGGPTDIAFSYDKTVNIPWTAAINQHSGTSTSNNKTLIFGGRPSRTALTDAKYAFLGANAAGDVWTFPQAKNTPLPVPSVGVTVAGAFDSYVETDPRVVAANGATSRGWVKIALDGVVNAPAGGQISVWDDGPTPTAWITTANGIQSMTAGGKDADAVWVAPGQDTHYNWSFTAPGVYEVRLNVSATVGRVATSSKQTVFFAVDTYDLNLAPVNVYPADFKLPKNETFAFGPATAAISFTDPDDTAGNAPIRIKLSATNGNLAINSNLYETLIVAGANNSPTLTLQSDRGSVIVAMERLSFTPTANFVGDAKITIGTNDLGFFYPDGYGISGPAADGAAVADGVPDNFRTDSDTFTITVTDNLRPTITGLPTGIFSFDEDTTSPPVNFTIGDDLTPPTNLTVTANTTANNVSLVLGGSGANRFVRIVPGPNVTVGGYALVNVTVNDGQYNTVGTFKFHINEINDAPVLVNPASVPNQVIDEDSTPYVSTPDGEPVVFELYDPDGTTPFLGYTSSDPLLFPPTYTDGGYTFSSVVLASYSSGTRQGYVALGPAPNRFGTSTITLWVADSAGAKSASRTFQVTVTPVYDSPVVNIDHILAIPDRTSTFDVLTNDVFDAFIDPQVKLVGFTQPAHGVVTATATPGVFRITPTPGYVTGSNLPDAFTYTISDVQNNEYTQTVRVRVANTLPISFEGGALFDTQVSVDYHDGEWWTYAKSYYTFGHDPSVPDETYTDTYTDLDETPFVVDGDRNGVLKTNSSAAPIAGIYGVAVGDTYYVQPTNLTAQFAVAESVPGTFASPVQFKLVAATAPAGGYATFAKYVNNTNVLIPYWTTFGGIDSSDVFSLAPGAATFAGTYFWTFSKAGRYEVRFQAVANVLDANGSVVSITSPVNTIYFDVNIASAPLVENPPKAHDDAAAVDRSGPDGAATIPVLANDSSAPDPLEALSVTGVTQPASGIVSIAAGGQSVVYTPNAGFYGVDTFTYTITDEHGGTATATVTVTVQNTPPTASVSLDKTNPGTADTLTATATVNDADGDPVTLTYVWKVNGVVRRTFSTASLTDAFNLASAGNGDRGDTVTVEVTPQDGRSGATVSAEATVANTAPTAAVSFNAPSPRTDTVLTAIVTPADPDGDPVSLIYVWKVNGVIRRTVTTNATADTFDLGQAGNGDRGDAVTVEVTPLDGTSTGIIAMVAATVTNSAPTATVSLNTAMPRTNDTLTATAVTADADGDPVTLTYVWRVNGVVRRTFTTTALADAFDLSQPGNGDRGQAVTVTVTASDGTATGPPATASATVNSTPPTVTVALNATNPRTRDTLTATAARADIDGDVVSLTYVWKVNGFVRRTFTTTALTDAFDLSQPGNGDRGQTVTVDVTPNDGSASGAAASASAVVVNSAPAASVGLSSLAPATNAILTATATATDADGDPVSLTYVWKVNGVVRRTATTTELSDTFDLSQLGNGDRGDLVAVEVTPSDSTATGVASTASAAVTDSAPTATVNLDSANPATADVLTATAGATDADGDPVTLTYVWKVNGVVRRTVTTTGLTDTFDLGVSGNGDRGQVVTVEVTPTAGSLNGRVAAASATVADTAPTAGVSLSSPSPRTADVLTATAVASDLDGDAVTLTYVWKVNGVIRRTATTTALTDAFDLGISDNGDRGETITVEVIPNDGFTTGAFGSAAATVINSGPNITTSMNKATARTDETLVASAVASEPDGDPTTQTFVWKVDGAVRRTTTTTALTDTFDLGVSGNGDRGDVITVEVTTTDGVLTSPTAFATANVVNASPLVSVGLNSTTPATGEVLTATAIASDLDADPVSLTYVWKVNDTVRRTVTTNASADTFDLGEAGNGDRGDTVTVEVTPTDGTTTGPVAVAAATVANTPPVAVVSLDNANPTTNDVLTATAVSSDPDGDSVTLTYLWKVNGVVRRTTTTATGSDTFDLAGAGNGGRGDSVTVEVTPTAGTQTGPTATASVVVAVTPPVPTVLLNSSAPQVGDRLTATATATDPDGDPVTWSFVWKVNGVVKATRTGVTEPSDSFDLRGNAAKGDTITVEAVPSDGTLVGGTASAGAVVVNTAPTAIVRLSDSTPATDATLTATATVSDADAEPVTLTYVWTVNGTVRRTVTTAALTDTFDLGGDGNGDDGDTVGVQVTPADGTANGPDATASVTIVKPRNPNAVRDRQFAAGPDAGTVPTAVLYDPDGSVRFQRTIFPSNFTGGVRVATGDFNGDGVADLVIGTGPGIATDVRILDGTDGHQLFAVNPFEPAFTGGVYVTAGDLTGDGIADLVVTPDEGGGPRVLIYNGPGFGPPTSFFGIDDPNFRGGARAAVGDLNGDGRADLIVAAGFGGGPRVATYDGRSMSPTGPRTKLFNDFFVFEQTLRNGVFVAVGDLDGDGRADLIAGGGPGGGPRVMALSGADLAAGRVDDPRVLFNDFLGSQAGRGGVRIAVKDLDGDDRADLIVGAGLGAGGRLAVYRGDQLLAGPPRSAFELDPFGAFQDGVFVG